MESSNKIDLRYFPLKEDFIYAQFSTQMTESAFNSLTGTAAGEKKGAKSSGTRAMILCLDKSGSMSGKPFTALKEGAIMLGKSLFEQGQFQEFHTIFYDSKINAYQAKNFEQFQQHINKQSANNSTNFLDVFKHITTYLKSAQIEDLSVIFFTDGQDTCNTKGNLEKELDKLKQACKNVRSRFLTIGFTSGHDAIFMNRIAQVGSELGNFFYVDTAQPSYGIQIQDCLKSSLDMAVSEEEGLQIEVESHSMEFKHLLTLSKNYVLPENEDEGEEEMKIDENSMLDLTNSLIIRENALQDLVVRIKLGQDSKSCQVNASLVSDPSPEILSKAAVKLINKLIFDSIQKLQDKDQSMSAQDGYDYIKELDKEIDGYAEMTFKIKDKDLKKEIFDDIQDCKAKTIQIMEILRQSQGTANNGQIALLNDLAYRTVRAKKGFQKKLDERAIKNEKFYKKLENQVKGAVKNLDFAEIKKNNQALMDQIGSCPLSCYDMVEAMQAGDCMCLCLDVGRTQAALADPTKLVIKDIIPTFMTSESFLDSAIFNLSKNQDAHGNFDISNEGKLAMGVGRENVTGVMPLYFFKEHWEIAKRKAAPVYGFLCTLDIMGYASNQFFTIPYLVLLKCIEKSHKEQDKEMFKNILGWVQQTCVTMLQTNEEFRSQTVALLKNFALSPENRTIDIVPSVPVMLAQMYCLMQLPDYHQYLGEDFKLDQATLALIFRYSIEEMLRRSQKPDQNPLTKGQILKVLFPDFEEQVGHIMKVRAQEIAERMKKGEQNSNDVFAPYQAQADILKSLDKAAVSAPGSKEEEKKEEPKAKGGEAKVEMNIDMVVEAMVAGRPWTKEYANQESQVSKLVNGAAGMFAKKHTDVMRVAQLLQVVGAEEFEVKKFPGLEGDQDVFFAMLFQNAMHPKNHQRREACTNKTYVDICNKESADSYLKGMLKTNLRNEISGRESAIIVAHQQSQSSEVANLFYSAPNIYLAAAVLQCNGFYNGKGDMASVVRQLIKGQEPLPAAKDKLILIQMGIFHGIKLYADKFKVYPDRFNLKPKRVFKLWMSCVRARRDLSGEQFMEAFPEFERRIAVWNKCVDVVGKPTLNYDQFMLHVKESRKRSRLQQKVAQAKKAKKGKI